jgi:hypothetical protein
VSVLIGSPLIVQGNVSYFNCLNQTWVINANTVAPWQPFSDLELSDVVLSFNKSLNATSNTSIYDGIIHAAVVFFGVNTTTDIYFTNNKLVSMLIEFSYTNSYATADALLYFEAGCAAENGPLATGNGSVALVGIADNANITANTTMSYYGTSCPNAHNYSWELQGYASVSNLVVFGVPLSANINLTLSRDLNNVTSGEIIGNMNYFGVQAMADAKFDSINGLTALFVGVNYTDGNLIELNAFLNYTKDCTNGDGDVGSGAVTLIGITGSPVLDLNGNTAFFNILHLLIFFIKLHTTDVLL